MSERTETVDRIPAVMDSERAGEIVGGDSKLIRREVREGRLKAYRVGRELRIRGVDLLEWLERRPARGKHGEPLNQDGAVRRVAGAAANAGDSEHVR